MRLALLLGVAFLGAAGWALLSARAWVIAETHQGWAQVCHDAPIRVITDSVKEGLREARVQVGLHGWSPTVAWINEQCEVLGV